MRGWPWSRAGVAGLACCAPAALYAHSFAAAYVLPVPFWMYVYGCAATLVVTFALLGFFASAPVSPGVVSIRELNTSGLARLIGVWGLWLLRAGAAGCLLLTIAAGFIGTTEPTDNIAPTLFWVIFLLGFTYLTLLAGDLFALINPWQLAVQGLERLSVNLSVARVAYPRGWGCWPAFLFYVILIWLELFVALEPVHLSIVLSVYSLLTVAGAAIFGKHAWFANAEFFSVFFRLVGKLAPVKYKPPAVGGSWQVKLRPPFSGALHERPGHISVVLFVLFVLSSTTYDSIHQTSLWAGLFWRNLLVLLQPLWGSDLGKAQSMLMDWYLIYRQAGLLVFPFLYLGVYVLVLWWTKVLTRTSASVRNLALDFCYTLLPVAVAYHFTHYFTYLIVTWQALPALLTDPFGFGWDLLRIGEPAEPPPLQMGVVWHTQVAVLLAGHVVSVYLAHKVAARIFPTQSKVIVSQLPLLLLMVVYTLAGLWILSLPLASE